MISRLPKSNRKIKKLCNDANDEWTTPLKPEERVFRVPNNLSKCYSKDDLYLLKYNIFFFAFIYDQINNNIDEVDAHSNSDEP